VRGLGLKKSPSTSDAQEAEEYIVKELRLVEEREVAAMRDEHNPGYTYLIEEVELIRVDHIILSAMDYERRNMEIAQAGLQVRTPHGTNATA